jgi:dethiobiotin synthetase
MPVPGLFITGTDTDVGKTVLACAIAATLADAGHGVRVFKPVVTGIGDAQPGRAPDHDLLRAAARSSQSAQSVAPYRFDPPVSPHLAAESAGTHVEPLHLLGACAQAGAGGDVMVVEGVGGLLVPLARDYLVRDLAVALGFPVVVAARPGLGTISHTLMTVECARAAGLHVRAVVLTPWTDDPTTVERSNMETIGRITKLDVLGLPRQDACRPAVVPGLPVESWLGQPRPALAAA